MNTETPLKRIKTSKIVYVLPSDTMMKAEEIFDNVPIHHILVMDQNRLVGIISKNDLLRVYKEAAAAGEIPNRSSILISEFMTSDPVTLDTEDTIGLAADIFLTNQFHSIPIMNGAHLVGIITNHDLIKHCFR